MPIRPGMAKGPFVGPSAGAGAFAPVDAQYVVMALDATLTQERVLTAGSGITIVDGGANNPVTISTSGAVGTEAGIPTFHDDFNTARPFWDVTDAITSGDWQINTGTGKLDGIAENNLEDRIRYSVEGDIDYQVKVERGTATSGGIVLYNGAGTVIARLKRTAAGLLIECTGEANQTPAVGADTMWLRMTWEADGTIRYYWKINDTDPWTLQTTFTGKEFGHDKDLLLDSANGGHIQEIYIFDNMYSHQVRALAPKKRILTDAASIAIDASSANFFEVTLGGNRQLANPTNPISDGQKILLRVWQDGTGSRTLTYDTQYRFSTDLPSPTLTTDPGDYDYLGFIYNATDNTWDFVGKVFGFAS